MLKKEKHFFQPQKTRKLYADYEKDSDTISLFADECLIKSEGARIKITSVYNRYKEWTQENGHRPCAKKNFVKRMKKHFKIEEYIGQLRLFEYELCRNNPFE